MRVVAIVVHSETGRTRALADAVARGAAAIADTETHVIPVADATGHTALLAKADAIVFGCPTYMGSASAAFKAFMDATTTVWALQGWRDKLAAAFTHSAAPSGDKLGTLTQLAVFAAQHGMVWIGLGLPPTYATTGSSDDTNRLGSHLGAMAQSPPGRAVCEADLRTAEHLGRRVAEAAQRWGPVPVVNAAGRHPTAANWVFPPSDRPALAAGLWRGNLRELAARADRFEHHLLVVASIGGTQLEIATASEPLYFGHINISDEYAIALPTGDGLVDRFPLWTMLSDAASGADVGRYKHRIGDLVLHPLGYQHWPGRLKPPYAPFEIPAGMRRTGLTLVYCASRPTPSTPVAVPLGPDRATDVKPYAPHTPPMMLAPVHAHAGVVARIGSTTMTIVERPVEVAPPRGGWVVVLEADGSGDHVATDLVRIAEGARLTGQGIVRALVVTSPEAAPDPVPPTWAALPSPPFAPFDEHASRGELPITMGELAIAARSEAAVTVAVRGLEVEVPRYWLARALFRVALHDYRLGYIEIYGGMFFDDHAGASSAIEVGVRAGPRREAIAISRTDIAAFVERLYRAVAPAGYVERLA